MNERDIVRGIMRMQGKTYADMAAALGYKRYTNVQAMLTRDTRMGCGTLIQFLDELGYDLVIRSREGDAEYVVSGEERERKE